MEALDTFQEKLDAFLSTSTMAGMVFMIEMALSGKFADWLKKLDAKKDELGKEKHLSYRQRLLGMQSELEVNLREFMKHSDFQHIQKGREEDLKVWQRENFVKRLEGFLMKTARVHNRKDLKHIIQDQFPALLLELSMRKHEVGKEKYERYKRSLWTRKSYLEVDVRMAKELADFDAEQAKDERIKIFLARRVHWEETEEDAGKLKELLKQVLSQTWDILEPAVMKVESIRLARSPHAYRIRYAHAPGKIVCDPEVWSIVLPAHYLWLLADTESRRFLRYIICHELCHVKLQHDIAEEEEERQAAADKLAAELGFPPPEPTDPKETRNVWALIDELREPVERLDETYERLIEEGVIKKAEIAKREKAKEKKKGG